MFVKGNFGSNSHMKGCFVSPFKSLYAGDSKGTELYGDNFGRRKRGGK